MNLEQKIPNTNNPPFWMLWYHINHNALPFSHTLTDLSFTNIELEVSTGTRGDFYGWLQKGPSLIF